MLATIRLLWVKNENCELMDCVVLYDSVDEEDMLVEVGVAELLLPVGNEITETVADALLLLIGADVMPELDALEVPLAEIVTLAEPDAEALPETVLVADCEAVLDCDCEPVLDCDCEPVLDCDCETVLE